MDKREEANPCFGQIVFYESIEKSMFRQPLARVALNLGGREADYPVDLAEIVRQLPWRECQAVLAMASLSASARFRWRADQEQFLVAWAAETNDQGLVEFLSSLDSATALAWR